MPKYERLLFDLGFLLDLGLELDFRLIRACCLALLARVLQLAVVAWVACRTAAFQLAVRAGVALHVAVFQLAVRTGVAVLAVAFQLAVRTGVAVLAGVFHLAVRAGVAVHAAAFHSAVGAGVGAGVAILAAAFQLPVRARFAVRAVAFHLPVRAGGALRAVVLRLAVGTRVTVHALAFLPSVRPPLHSHNSRSFVECRAPRCVLRKLGEGSRCFLRTFRASPETTVPQLSAPDFRILFGAVVPPRRPFPASRASVRVRVRHGDQRGFPDCRDR